MIKKIFSLVIFMLIFSVSYIEAADYYVRPNGGGYGTGNGSDWNNAFNGFSGISWGSITAGDTLWIAGGSYTQNLILGSSGTSSGRIYIKRVLNTDTVPVAAYGWQSGFNSQVVTKSILFYEVNDYITIDGQITDGWKIDLTAGGSGVIFEGGADFVTLRYLEIQGQGYPFDYTSNGRGIDATAWPNYAMNDLLVEYCRIYNVESGMYLISNTNSIIQHNEIYGLKDPSPDNPCCHNNVIYMAGNNGIILRYNIVHDWEDEGFFVQSSGDNMQIYGNIFYDGYNYPGGNARFYEDKNTVVNTNIEIYNNVLRNMWGSIRFNHPSDTGIVKNNIFMNAGGASYPSGVSHDYNWYSGSYKYSELNGIAAGSVDPFVSISNNNYRLVATSTPKNNGANLGTSFNVDLDGNTRGGDGIWDIGAYEYYLETIAPSPPSNPAVN